MDFSPGQVKAIDQVATWLGEPDGPQIFRLFGYAGTGKTTLAKHLAEQQNEEVVFAAYTGKAASVLRRKGCPNSSTIHGLIYTVAPVDADAIEAIEKKLKLASGDERGKLIDAKRELNKPKFILKDNALDDFGLVVIDECSMVGQDVGADLLSFGCKVLVLGDPAQLPPIEGGGFFTEHTPDVLLTEIHRQAQGNPVINLATMVRQGLGLKPGRYGESLVQRRTITTSAQLSEAAQVICGTNKTRGHFNSLIRDAKNFTGVVPEVGEKIICLRNNHEEGLLNGTQWRVDSVKDEGAFLVLDLSDWDEPAKTKKEVKVHHFDLDLKDMPYYNRKRANEFTFGYTITCHKSQGSQWPDIFIQNESYCFRENSSRWLYTAITRAENKVVIAQ